MHLLIALSCDWARAGDDGTGGRRVIGLIAQEVQKVLPDVVYQDPVTGYLSVAYTVHTRHTTQVSCCSLLVSC
jgi:hypothetical protein